MSHLQFVDRSNHVDTVVYNVGDRGVYLAVEGHQAEVTQFNLTGSLQKRRISDKRYPKGFFSNA